MEDDFYEDDLGLEERGFDLDLLLSVAGGLGRFQHTDSSKKVYEKDPDCLACLKDLQRFLRRDDPDTRDAFFKLGELQIASAHLVPLLTTYPHDEDLAFNTLKVLTFLTMPVDYYTQDPALQLQYARDVKEAMLSRDALAAVVALTAAPLSRHPRMTEGDHQTVQLVITFVRNLLAIPDPPPSEARGGRRARMHADLLAALMDESALELVVLVAGHVQSRPFKSDGPLLLDVLCEVVKGLASADVANATEPQEQQQQQGQHHYQQQRAQQRPKPQQRAPPVSLRHGRFKSTLVMRHSDSARSTFTRVNAGGPGTAPGSAAASVSAAVGAPPDPGALSTRVPDAPPRALGAGLVWRLKGVVDALLEGPYNILMASVRAELEPGLGISRLEPPDFVKWMTFSAWTAAYVRTQEEKAIAARGGSRPPAGAASPFGCVGATMCWEAFALVHKIWVEQSEITPGRNRDKDWSLQHSSTRLLREMLGLLDLAEKAGTDADRSAAERLARRLLHDDMKESGLLPVLAKLIKRFSDRFEPRSAAVTLAESVHLVLRLYDRLVAREGGKFYVRARRARAVRRKLKAALDPEAAPEGPEGAEGAAAGADAPAAVDKETGAPAAAAAAEGTAAAGTEGAAAAEVGAATANGDAAAEGGAAAAAAEGGAAASPPAKESGAPSSAVRESSPEAAAAAAAADGAATEQPAAAPEHAQCEPSPAKEGEQQQEEVAAAGDDTGNAVAAAAAAAAAADDDGAAAAKEGRGSLSPEPPDVTLSGSAAAAAVAGKTASAGGGGGGGEGVVADAAGRAVSEEPAASAAASGQRAAAEPEGDDLLMAPVGGAAGGWRGRAPLEEMDDEEDEDDEEGGNARYEEVAFDLKKRIKQELAVPAIMHFYLWLLQGFDTAANTAALNHALCSFLWRMVLPEHLNLEPMLYHLSALRLFHRALADPSLRGRPEHKELLLLATRVTRGLFKRLVPGDAAGDKAGDKGGKDRAAAGAAGGQEEGTAARRLAFDGEEGEGEGAAAAGAAAGGVSAEEKERERAARVRSAVAAMGFVELLFWSPCREVEAIRDDYHLNDTLLTAGAGAGGKGRGGRGRGRGARGGGAAGAGWGDDDVEGWEGGNGFGGMVGEEAERAPRLPRQRKALAPLLNAAGEEKLKKLFEGMAATKDNLERLTAALGATSISSAQVARELRRLGLKFGSLPPWLAPKLAELWAAHRGKGAKGEDLQTVADQLPGGWEPNQIRKLLRQNGLLGGGGRRRGGRDEEDGWASDVEGGDPHLEVERSVVEDLYCRYLAEDDYLEKIASELPEELGATPATVLATLRFIGINPHPPPGKRAAPKPRRARGGGGGGGGRRGGAGREVVDKRALAGLWESHRGEPDALNLVAMELGCGVMQVRNLLRKYKIEQGDSSSDDDSDSDGGAASSGSESEGGAGSESEGEEEAEEERRSAKKRGRKEGGGRGAGRRAPVDEERLRALWEGAKDSPDALDRVAEQLPVPASNKQVARWLTAAGIRIPRADKPATTPGGAGGSAKKRAKTAPAAARTPLAAAARTPLAAARGAAGTAAVAAASAGAVPEPRPAELLGFLEAIERAHSPGSRWLSAAAAVEWIQSKLSAAEQVWAALGGTGAALQDYSLVPSGDADFDFFCTDWSNELLEAAGVRNDEGDFFKVPVRGGAEWRQRVRDALSSALALVGTPEASAALDGLRLEERAARAAEAAARARKAEEEAEIAAALFKSSKKKGAAAAAGGGGAAGKKRASTGDAGGSGAGKRAKGAGGGRKQRRAAAAATGSDDGWESDDGAAGRRALSGSPGGSAPMSDAEDSEPLVVLEDLSDSEGVPSESGGAGVPDSQPMFAAKRRGVAVSDSPPPDSEPMFFPADKGDGGKGSKKKGGAASQRSRLSAAKRGALEEIARRQRRREEGTDEPRRQRRRAAVGSDEEDEEEGGAAGGSGSGSDDSMGPRAAVARRDQARNGVGRGTQEDEDEGPAGSPAPRGGRLAKRLRLQPAAAAAAPVVAAVEEGLEDDLADF